MNKCPCCGYEEKNNKPYFKKLESNKFKCLRCSFPETSFMGIMAHIRKHKNQEEKNKELHKDNLILK